MLCRFTYGVKALGLACDTHHFQVSGKDVKEHAMKVKAAEAHSEQKEKDKAMAKDAMDKQTAAAAEPAMHDTATVSADSRTLPAIHEISPAMVIPPLGMSDMAPAAPMDRIAPAVDRMAEPLDLNAGVCPLLPFTQQLKRASASSDSDGAGLYTLAFHNQSPSLPLAFLDVHFSINSGPNANLRLFSEQPVSSSSQSLLQSNEARGLDGIAMVAGDVIEYSFTYGVKEAGAAGGKVRACNTEVYKAKVDESIK